MSKDGGPAFPVLDVDEHRQPYNVHPGISKLEFFAAAALMPAVSLLIEEIRAGTLPKEHAANVATYVSKIAREIAAAMLAESERRSKE